jgi:glycosyltransferase involved in cell wall biosynthesis
VISPASVRGGAEEYALTIAMAAKSRGWVVTAAVPEADGTRSLVDDLHNAGIPVRTLPCIDPWEGGTPPTVRDLWSATGQTIRLLRKVRPDVVHLTIPWPSSALSSLLAPAILSVPAVVVFALVPQTLALPYPAVLYKAMRARRQQWVAVSAHGRRVIANGLGVPLRSIEHIANGVPRARLAVGGDEERAAARAAVRRELGLPSESRLIVSVGRLHKQKAHADLCVAAASLVRRHAELYVLVAGEGPERPELESLTNELELRGRFLLLGLRHDVPDLLLAADVFAFPSHFEGMPFALIEAMAAGLPVVTAAFPGVDEIIDHSRDGMITPIGDIPALIDALDVALARTEAIEAMARLAQERARTFSEERMLDRTLALLADWPSSRRPRFSLGAA